MTQERLAGWEGEVVVTQADIDMANDYLTSAFRCTATLAERFARHRLAAIEECAKACEQQAKDFLSPEYATGQPLSSFSERFACGQCAEAIRDLALPRRPPLSDAP